MRTLVPDPPPAEIEVVLQRRRRTGADVRDEVWEGVLHMAPASRDVHADVQQQFAVLLDAPARAAGLYPTISIFNLGEPEDYRVPDGALHRDRSWGTWASTAALVVEIVSPGDLTWDKRPFYAAHEVDDLLIVNPQERSVDWLALERGEYRPVRRSLIDLGPAVLAERIDWPSLKGT